MAFHRDWREFSESSVLFFDTGLSDDFIHKLRHQGKITRSKIKRGEKVISRFSEMAGEPGTYTAPEVVEEMRDVYDIMEDRSQKDGLDRMADIWKGATELSKNSVYPLETRDRLPVFCVSMAKQNLESGKSYRKSSGLYKKRFRHFRKDGNLIGFSLDSSLKTGAPSVIVTYGTRLGELLVRCYEFLASPELDNVEFLERMERAPVTIYRQTQKGYTESVSTGSIGGLSDFSGYWKSKRYIFDCLREAQDMLDQRELI